jgi:hypothetical protein
MNLVKNPAQKTNPVRIFVDGAVPFYRAAKNLQVFAIMSTQLTTKTPNQNQHLSNFPRSTRTLLMFLKRLMLINSPPIVHMIARLI